MALEHAGQSLVGMLWDQLDSQYNKLKELHAETKGIDKAKMAKIMSGTYKRADGPPLSVDNVMDYLQTQGKVQALCFAVGTILYPYEGAKERIDKVREELPQRWEDAYGEPDDDAEEPEDDDVDE